jgi:hypothetical protein
METYRDSADELAARLQDSLARHGLDTIGPVRVRIEADAPDALEGLDGIKAHMADYPGPFEYGLDRTAYASSPEGLKMAQGDLDRFAAEFVSKAFEPELAEQQAVAEAAERYEPLVIERVASRLRNAEAAPCPWCGAMHEVTMLAGGIKLQACPSLPNDGNLYAIDTAALRLKPSLPATMSNREFIDAMDRDVKAQEEALLERVIEDVFAGGGK